MEKICRLANQIIFYIYPFNLMLMIYKDTVYGSVTIEEKVLIDLIQTNAETRRVTELLIED